MGSSEQATVVLGRVGSGGGAHAVSAHLATSRWPARPGWARVVRLSVTGVSLATVVAGTWLVARRIPPWHGWAFGARVAVLVLVSLSLTFVLDRAARRLLPLAMLLELSVTLPDRLPGRFSVAMRAANTRRLYRDLERSEAPSTATEAITRAVLMLGALAVHDRRTRGHCERVRALNDLMAEELGLDAEEQEKLRWAALLHDIGKLDIPTRILNKPSAPSPDEWHALQMHPEVGDHMIEPLRPWLGEWADAVGHHHEHWDGSGYPHGLAGKEISLAGRIVALVDAYEVMTAVRPYQRPVSPAAARAEMVRCAGSHFDPALVRTFLNISIGRLRRAMGAGAWLAQFPLIAVAPRVEVASGLIARQSVMTVASATTAGAAATALAVATTMPSAPAPVSINAAPLSAQESAVVAHSHGPVAYSHSFLPGGVVSEAETDATDATTTSPHRHGSGQHGSAGSAPASQGAKNTGGHGSSTTNASAARANHGVAAQQGHGLAGIVQSAATTAAVSSGSTASLGRHLGWAERIATPPADPSSALSSRHTEKGA